MVLCAWERVSNVSALIRNGVSSSSMALYSPTNLILATGITAAPSAYAASDTDPYDSGYEGDDEREADSVSWR